MILVILFIPVLFCSFAVGEMNTELPESATKPFQTARWEGYQPVVVSGYGDENSPTGQYAVLMKKDDHNVLCMVEKEQGQAEFIITVENDKAVYQNDLLPSLLIDSGGDTLFYTYQRDDESISSEHYHSSKIDGQWSPVDITLHFQPRGDRFAEVFLYANDGDLWQQVLWMDENGNIIEQGGEFAVGIEEGALYDLQHFSIEQNMAVCKRWRFETNNWGGLFYNALPDLPRSVRDMLPQNQRFLYGQASEDTVFTLSEAGDGSRQILIFDRAENGYSLTARSTPLGMWRGTEVGIDSHSGGNTLYLFHDEGSVLFAFARTHLNTWALRTVQGRETFAFDAFGLHNWYPEQYLYGTISTIDLSTLNVAELPATFSEASRFVDSTGWAVVKSDKPTDRLHLRTAPSTNAASMGRYYSGTPVQILDDQGEWAKVSVAGIQGYMMKKFLAFGQDILAVERWFPSKILVEADAEQGVNVYASPGVNSDIVGVLRWHDGLAQYILANVGDDWYHVLRDDGLSGYVEVQHFWDGNG